MRNSDRKVDADETPRDFRGRNNVTQVAALPCHQRGLFRFRQQFYSRHGTRLVIGSGKFVDTVEKGLLVRSNVQILIAGIVGLSREVNQ
eukprot:scaffold992_cov175-Amphora_coffeaeformis.AAC.4